MTSSSSRSRKRNKAARRTNKNPITEMSRENHISITETPEEDRISELPYDILVRIVSFLTFKQAGRTSVLSKRWTHVWTYFPALNFVPRTVCFSPNSMKKEEPTYVRWVDKVVRSHNAPTIDEFKIHYGFEKSTEENFHTWIRFAMEKKVKRLRLDISLLNAYRQPVPFTFPSLFPSTSLTSLELAGVHITDQVLEKLLYDCQTLESLSVAFAKSLVDLKVAGLSLNLKFLAIQRCFGLKKLEISAPNLLSFNHSGLSVDLHLKSIPKLAELSIIGRCADDLMAKFPDTWDCSHIEVLTLSCEALNTDGITNVFPLFPRLKILNVTCQPAFDRHLFNLFYLIKNCPLMHKLVLKLKFMTGRKMMRSFMRTKVEACPHDRLKIVEMLGFVGCEIQMAFFTRLIETAPSLEKMTVEPPPMNQFYDKAVGSTIRSAGRRQAEMELRPLLKPGTELEICCS